MFPTSQLDSEQYRSNSGRRASFKRYVRRSTFACKIFAISQYDYVLHRMHFTVYTMDCNYRHNADVTRRLVEASYLFCKNSQRSSFAVLPKTGSHSDTKFFNLSGALTFASAGLLQPRVVRYRLFYHTSRPVLIHVWRDDAAICPYKGDRVKRTVTTLQQRVKSGR